MLKWLKWKLAGAELARLDRWERAWQEHDRWLALSSPEADLVLRNLKAHVDGKALDCCWPPGERGPWEISRLREVLRTRGVKTSEAPSLTANLIRAIADECGMFNDAYENTPGEYCDKFAQAILAASGVSVPDGQGARGVATDGVREIDGCERCGGSRGGVPGNENRLNGKVLCDYCTADAIRADGAERSGGPKQ